MEFVASFLPVLIKVAFMMLENYLTNNAQDVESRDLFLNLASMLRAKGIQGVRSRFESESQIGAGDAEWNNREKNEK